MGNGTDGVLVVLGTSEVRVSTSDWHEADLGASKESAEIVDEARRR